MLPTTHECGAPLRERRHKTTVLIPETKIGWIPLKKTNPEIFDGVEREICNILAEKRYPLSPTMLAKNLKDRGFIWPVRLNRRNPATVIKCWLDKGLFDNLRFVALDNGMITGYIWHNGTPSYHDKWIDAMVKLAEGKRVVLK